MDTIKFETPMIDANDAENGQWEEVQAAEYEHFVTLPTAAAQAVETHGCLLWSAAGLRAGLGEMGEELRAMRPEVAAQIEATIGYAQAAIEEARKMAFEVSQELHAERGAMQAEEPKATRAEFKQFWAVSFKADLNPNDGPKVREALSRFLGRAIESRRELTQREIGRAITAVEWNRLTW